MIHTEYSSLTTDEVVREVLNKDDPTWLELELVQRVEDLENEIEDLKNELADYKPIAFVPALENV